MVRLRVAVELKSSLVSGRGMDIGNVRESKQYIAGSAIRGTLAQAILAPLGIRKNAGRKLAINPQMTSREEAFRKVFLSEEPACFGNLYPFVLTDGIDSVEAFPVPITAFTCKPSPGFGEKNNGHGVSDRLLPSIISFISQKEMKGEACPKCGERMERMRGFVVREDEKYQKVKVPKRQFVRVGLSRFTESAEEGILYILEAILHKVGKENLPLGFVGNWRMSEEQWESLKSLLERFLLPMDGGYQLRMGSSRARGMGEAILRIWEESVPSSTLRERISRFQPRLEDGSLADEEYLYFSFTARSPILVLNENGESTMRLTPEAISAYVEATIPHELELIREATFVEQETATGWSQAWGMPKPVLPAISAGSVFTYRVRRSAEKLEDEKELLSFLKAIEENGIGERSREGFGEIVVCDPFHVHFSSARTTVLPRIE